MLRERQARVGPALMGRSRMGSGDGEEALPCKGTEPPLCGGDGCSSCPHQRGPSHLLLLLSVFLLQTNSKNSDWAAIKALVRDGWPAEPSPPSPGSTLWSSAGREGGRQWWGGHVCPSPLCCTQMHRPHFLQQCLLVRPSDHFIQEHRKHFPSSTHHLQSERPSWTRLVDPAAWRIFFFLTYSLKGRKLLWPIVKKQKVIFITILSQSRDPKILLNASRELPMLTCYVEPKFSASTKNNKKG